MAGRPEGSLKTPELSYQRELLAWLAIATQVRSLIAAQVEGFERKIKLATATEGTFNVDEQLKIMSGLASILETAIKTSESGLKFAAKADTPEATSPEALMQQLEGGKGA